MKRIESGKTNEDDPLHSLVPATLTRACAVTEGKEMTPFHGWETKKDGSASVLPSLPLVLIPYRSFLCDHRDILAHIGKEFKSRAPVARPTGDVYQEDLVLDCNHHYDKVEVVAQVRGPAGEIRFVVQAYDAKELGTVVEFQLQWGDCMAFSNVMARFYVWLGLYVHSIYRGSEGWQKFTPPSQPAVTQEVDLPPLSQEESSAVVNPTLGFCFPISPKMAKLKSKPHVFMGQKFTWVSDLPYSDSVRDLNRMLSSPYKDMSLQAQRVCAHLSYEEKWRRQLVRTFSRAGMRWLEMMIETKEEWMATLAPLAGSNCMCSAHTLAPLAGSNCMCSAHTLEHLNVLSASSVLVANLCLENEFAAFFCMHTASPWFSIFEALLAANDWQRDVVARFIARAFATVARQYAFYLLPWRGLLERLQSTDPATKTFLGYVRQLCEEAHLRPQCLYESA